MQLALQKRPFIITTAVVALHICLIAAALLWNIERITPKKEKLVVKTITLKTEKEVSPPKPHVEVAPTKPKADVPKPKETPKPAEKPKKSAPKPAPVPKKKTQPVVKQETNINRKKELLQKAQRNMAKISRQSVNKTEIAMPQIIENNQTGIAVDDNGYYQTLAQYLKRTLRLPEIGEVKIKLTLDRTGKFINVIIDHSENASNSAYVKKTLPNLKFPAFDSNFKDQNQYTFPITLSNESI